VVIWRNSFDGVPGTVVSNDLGGPGTSGDWGDPIVNLRNTADVSRVRYGDRAWHGRSSLMLGDDEAVSGNHGDVRLVDLSGEFSVSFYLFRTGDGWFRFLQDDKVNISDLYLDYGSGTHFVGWTEIPDEVTDELRDRWVRVEGSQRSDSMTWRFWWDDPESTDDPDFEITVESDSSGGYLFVQGGGSEAEHPPAYIDSVRVGEGEWLGPWRTHSSTSARGSLVLSGSASATSEQIDRVPARGSLSLSGSAGVAARVAKTSARGTLSLSGATTQRRDAGTSVRRVLPLVGSTEQRRDTSTSVAGRLVLRSRAVPSSDASLALDYMAGHIAPPFEPVDDDSEVVNRVQASRRDGGETTYSLEDGPLGTADPPAGVGVYDESVTLDVQRDEDLGSQASWRVHLGTAEGYRYPHATVNLVGRPQLTETVADRDTGSALQIINPPPWLPPGNIELMVEGYTETINAYTWSVEFNASQGDAWIVAQVLEVGEDGELLPPGESGTNRADTAGAELADDLDETAETFDVITREGPRWITSDDFGDEFPFDIMCGGETMRVQEIVGTGDTQQFSVVRAVNAVRLSHLSGEAVSLAAPAYVAL